VTFLDSRATDDLLRSPSQLKVGQESQVKNEVVKMLSCGHAATLSRNQDYSEIIKVNHTFGSRDRALFAPCCNTGGEKSLPNDADASFRIESKYG
jgi:hypothetical protein